VSFDREVFDEANQERLAAVIAGVTVGSVESVEEALLKTGAVPLVATLYDGSHCEPREVASQKGQRRRVKLTVITVTEGWRSKAGARIAALKLLGQVDRAIVTKGAVRGEWQNPQCETPYVAEGDSFMQRAGRRVAYQQEYYAFAYDDFD
jgi:hypothetical protein